MVTKPWRDSPWTTAPDHKSAARRGDRAEFPGRPCRTETRRCDHQDQRSASDLDRPGVRRISIGLAAGEAKLTLTVRHHGDKNETELPPFTPRTLPLHPTQLYESISMLLIFFVLMAFYPYRRHYGQVFVLLMLCYAVHRFFNETLRNDTDPVLFNLTLSQVVSLAVFAGGIAD